MTPVELGVLRGPHGLAAVGGKIWFTAEGAKVVGSYDPATQKADWVLGTGQNRTHMIAVSPDMKQILTINVASGSVSFLEKITRPQGPGGPPPGGGGQRPPPPMGVQTDWDETVVKVGQGAEGFDISPDGKQVWVANAQDGTVSVIDKTKKSVAETLNLDVRGANRLKFTQDGKLALISIISGPDLVVVEVATKKVMKRIPLGHGAEGLQMDPSGARAFVACTADDYVAVIDLKKLEVTGKIDVGGQPDGMAWAIQR